MNIAFWSNVNEKCGVSANLAAISLASVIRFPYKILVVENHLCSNNLGQAYLGSSRVDMVREVGTNYYEGGGIECLLRKINRGLYYYDHMEPYIKEIIYNHLYYIPQSKVIHKDIFNYELYHNISPMFEFLENHSNISFIDTASSQNLSSQTILEKSDFIVVNLCQNSVLLEDFFLNYSSIIPKAVFIISKYSKQSIFNSKKLSQMYDIPKEHIVAIPYNEMFCNAFLNGSIIEFMNRNYVCDKNNPNYDFIQAVKRATNMIMKKVELMSGLSLNDYLRKERISN